MSKWEKKTLSSESDLRKENYADMESIMQILVDILTKDRVLMEASCPVEAGSRAKSVLWYIISLNLCAAP